MVSEGRTKRAFRQALKGKVFTRLFGVPSLNTWFGADALKNIVGEKLAELNYEDHKGAIRSVLLLFNIANPSPEQRIQSSFSIRQL